MAQLQNRNNNTVNDARRTAIMAGRNVENIPQLRMVKVNQKRVVDGVQCTICLETFILNEKVAKLKCKHIFHRACIQTWLQRNNTCPICRAKVEWHREDAVNERLHHRHIIENVPIINAAARGIAGIIRAVENGNERIRKALENVEELNRRAIANVERKVANVERQMIEMAGRGIVNLIRRVSHSLLQTRDKKPAVKENSAKPD